MPVQGNLVIAKTKRQDPQLRENRFSSSVNHNSETPMPFAVNLDTEHCLWTVKIENVPGHGVLPSELVASSAVTELLPNEFLGGRHPSPQGSSHPVANATGFAHSP